MPGFIHNAGDVLFTLRIALDKAVAPRIPGKPSEGKAFGFLIFAGDISGKSQLMLARSRRFPFIKPRFITAQRNGRTKGEKISDAGFL